MARPKLSRLFLTASLLATAGMASVLLPPDPATAVDNVRVDISVSDMAFSPDPVTVQEGDIVVFTLTEQATVQHTVTFESNSLCAGRSPNSPCEQVFSEDRRAVGFRFPNAGEFPYYDRYARAQGGNGMHGTIFVTDVPTTTTTLEPTSSTTVVAPSTTTTTRPVTTTSTLASSTSTSAPSTVHPFLIQNPGTTTTTAAPRPAGGTPAGATKTGGGSNADKDKDKGKGKAASTEPPATVAPAPPEGLPGDRVFDPASLTPAPEAMPGAATPTVGTVEELDPATIALLHAEDSSSNGDTRLVLMIAIGLTLLVLGGTLIAWYRRSSRYFPA